MFRILAALAVATALGLAARAAGPDFDEISDGLDAATLDFDAAVDAAGLELPLAWGTLRFESGALVPARSSVAGSYELTFVGRARLELDAPDDGEAEQLAYATGGPRLRATVVEAVLVFGDGRAAGRIADRAAAVLETSGRERAAELFRGWVEDAGREGFGADVALLRAAAGDPVGTAFVGAWLETTDFGRLYYRSDPSAEDTVEVGAYELFDDDDFKTRRQRKQDRRYERRQRRSGVASEDADEAADPENRPCGARHDDREDDEEFYPWIRTWAAGRGPERAERAGIEPEHYEIDLDLEGDDLISSGTARLRLRADTDGLRTVTLSLGERLDLCDATDADGRSLSFARRGWTAIVALSQPTSTGKTFELRLRFAGEGVRHVLARRTQRYTIDWHPHAGALDRATYDVTLRWPAHLALLASGTPVDEGVGEDGRRFSHRRLDVPSDGFSFEIDEFDVVRDRVGHLDLEFGFHRRDRDLTEDRRAEIIRVVKAALLFFETRIGLLPIDRLTVAVADRGFSQGLLGFVTLSEGVVAEEKSIFALLTDPRTAQERRLETIAHEVSHQWWGNLVGWDGYRDQWLSEALADFSAAAFMVQIAPSPDDYRRRRAQGWRVELDALTFDGRPQASLGPVVLGRRLWRNHGPAAYAAIVYTKGSVVFGTLAQRLGETETWSMLGALARAVGNRVIATDTFFGAMEHMSGRPLDGFVRQYVRSSGLPELFWTVRTRRDEAGQWFADGTVELLPGARYRYAARAVGGGWDVVRRAAPPIDVSDWVHVVPFRAVVEDAGAGDVLDGAITARGRLTAFTIPLGGRPEELRLDPSGENLARLHAEDFRPKRFAFERGEQLLRLGNLDEAAAALDAALAADVATPGELAPADAPAADEGQRLDCRIRLARARLALDRADAATARDELRAAEGLVPRDEPEFWAGERAVLAARLDLLRDDATSALARLRAYNQRFALELEGPAADRLLDPSRHSALRVARGELLGLLAIAARREGDPDADVVVRLASIAGVDMRALTRRGD